MEKIQQTIYLEKDIQKKLKMYALKNDTSITKIIDKLIKELLND